MGRAKELFIPEAETDKGSDNRVLREKVGVDDAPFITSILDPGSVEAGETIIILGIVGIVFFLIFIVNLLIWARQSNRKPRQASDLESSQISIQPRSHGCVINMKKFTRSD